MSQKPVEPMFDENEAYVRERDGKRLILVVRKCDQCPAEAPCDYCRQMLVDAQTKEKFPECAYRERKLSLDGYRVCPVEEIGTLILENL
jgi:hypothetical protein